MENSTKVYLQNFNNQERVNFSKNKIKKVVFQEPYDCLPNFYIDNGFKKGNCDCIKNKQQDCVHKEQEKPNFSFDLKSFLPILNLLNKGGGGLNNIASMLSGGNADGLSSLTNLLGKGNILSSLTGLFGKKPAKKENKKDIVCTDYEISKYTKVE